MSATTRGVGERQARDLNAPGRRTTSAPGATLARRGRWTIPTRRPPKRLVLTATVACAMAARAGCRTIRRLASPERLEGTTSAACATAARARRPTLTRSACIWGLSALVEARGSLGSTICTSWFNGASIPRVQHVRPSEHLPMDVGLSLRLNPYSSSNGNWQGACLNWVAEALECMPSQWTADLRRQVNAVDTGRSSRSRSCRHAFRLEGRFQSTQDMTTRKLKTRLCPRILAILRQHWLRRPVGLLLRLAASLAEVGVLGPVRDIGRAEGRRVGR